MKKRGEERDSNSNYNSLALEYTGDTTVETKDSPSSKKSPSSSPAPVLSPVRSNSQILKRSTSMRGDGKC